MLEESSQFVPMGQISGLYGVRGWVKIYSYTQPRENILSYTPWYLRQHGAWRPITLAEGKVHGKGVIARLEGIEDREAARRLVGTEISLQRAQLPPLGEQEYYWSDLMGLQVETVAGEPLGVIQSMLETGANDVMVVSGDRERLIPYIRTDVVVAIDLLQRRMKVDWDPTF